MLTGGIRFRCCKRLTIDDPIPVLGMIGVDPDDASTCDKGFVQPLSVE